MLVIVPRMMKVCVYQKSVINSASDILSEEYNGTNSGRMDYVNVLETR